LPLQFHAFACSQFHRALHRRNYTNYLSVTVQLDDDLAGLKKDFQRNFTVVMSLDMFGSKLL
jgi:hypothetical protein